MTDTTHRYVLALEIGEEAIRQGKWQQALTCFQTALTGLPREPRVYNGLGDTHLSLADRGRALACYKAVSYTHLRRPSSGRRPIIWPCCRPCRSRSATPIWRR